MINKCCPWSVIVIVVITTYFTNANVSFSFKDYVIESKYLLLYLGYLYSSRYIQKE